MTTIKHQRGAVDPAIIGGVLFALFLVGILGFWIVAQAKVSHPTGCVVVDKDRTTKKEGGSDMRVYTQNCGTLSVGDSLFDGHWSSSDTFASIEVGETYDFKTRGIRVPFLSMFPNIVEVTPR